MNNKSVWGLTMNGSKARIIKNLGSGADQEIFDIAAEPSHTGAIKTDRAGRSFASVGKSRSGMELHSDPVRNQERLFAESVTAYMSEAMDKGDIDALIVAASPRTLGDLRAIFGTKLLQKMVVETDKDYTGLPVNKLISVFDTLLKKRQVTPTAVH